MFAHRGSRNLGMIFAPFRLSTLLCKQILRAKVRKCNPIPDRPCGTAPVPPHRLALSWWLLVPAGILAVTLMLRTNQTFVQPLLLSLVSRNAFIGPCAAHLCVIRGQSHRETAHKESPRDPYRVQLELPPESQQLLLGGLPLPRTTKTERSQQIGPTDPVFQVTHIALFHLDFLNAEAVGLASNHS